MSDDGDIDIVAHAAEKAETERTERLSVRNDQDFVNVLATQSGRRFVWGLIEKSGYLRISFAGEDTHLSAFNEGRRNEGGRLWDEIERLAPDRLVQMRQEFAERSGNAVQA